MNPLKSIANFFTRETEGRKKFYDIPSVTGGFDIFRNFTWGGNGWSQTKGLKAYEKSLYVFACVKKIAQKTASVDWNLYRIINTAGDKQEEYVHEALDLLYKPNPFQTKAEFFEKYMINKLLAGETFVLKVRENGPGTAVKELWNLRPDKMRILINKNDPRLIVGYEFNRQDGRTIFEPEDIIHDAYPSPLDEFGGISALSAGQSRVDTEEYASNYQRYFFQNNARPDFILQTEGKVTGDQKEEIRESWDKRHKGSKKAGKGAILEGGLKYQQVSISQREMDYIESMRFTRDDILVAFQVPKPIVAITDDVNLANAKTAMEIFLKETIEPEISRLVEKFNEHLVYPEFGDNFFMHYDEAFIPSDEKQEAEINKIHLESGTKLINEVREEMGAEEIEGGWDLYKPLNMVSVGTLKPATAGKKLAESRMADRMKVFKGRSKAMKYVELRNQVEAGIYGGLKKEMAKQGYKSLPETDKKKDETEEVAEKEWTITKYIKDDNRDAYSEVVNKAIDAKGDRFKPELIKFADGQKQRVLRKLADRGKDVESWSGVKVKNIADELLDKTNEYAVLSELSIPFVQDFIESAGKDALEAVAPQVTFDAGDSIRAVATERAEKMSKLVNDTTFEKLSTTLGDGIEAGEGIAELSDRVASVYDEYDAYRAEMIARTEATAANNLGFIEGYRQSGVVNAKEWITAKDDAVRDSHRIDGHVVGIDEKFPNGLDYPGDPSAPPKEVINCRCVLAPAFRE